MTSLNVNTGNRQIANPQFRGNQNVSKPDETEKKKSLSKGAKWAGLALTALAIGGIYIATRGKSKLKIDPTPTSSTSIVQNNPVQQIKEMFISEFKRGKDAKTEGINRLINGKAILADGTNYTGKITAKCKDDSTVVMEYADGVLQKSTRSKFGGVKVQKLYEYDEKGVLRCVDELVGNGVFPSLRRIYTSKEVEGLNVIYTNNNKNKIVQDVMTGKILRNKGKDYFYNRDGSLKCTKDAKTFELPKREDHFPRL